MISSPSILVASFLTQCLWLLRHVYSQGDEQCVMVFQGMPQLTWKERRLEAAREDVQGLA